jgi:abortive infection AbiH-like protein
MNRLILIGNGFDLAHGIKSSFKDFIEGYLVNVANTFLQTDYYSDELIKIHFKYDHHTNSGRGYPIFHEDVLEILKRFQSNPNITFTFESSLLKSVYLHYLNLNWVDIEIEYFRILNIVKQNGGGKNLEIFNSQFEFLKLKLIEYLNIQQDSFKKSKNDVDNSLINCFIEEINPNEIVTIPLSGNLKPNELYFLNFNYTDTIVDYILRCKGAIPSTGNYIHGSLDGKSGEPIFGFGDEFDKNYLEFEDSNNNQLFKHIKSFEYLKNSNYYELIRFVETDDFQVHIYGHSCGVSDRTMLNQIFEHGNCKSIKIFYHKSGEGFDDFTEKTYEIARHFKEKGIFRKKIVPFTLSREMPQPNLSDE